MKDKPIIKLNGWQTIKDYAAAKGTNPNTVSMWVIRDQVQHIKFPMLNNLVLVKEKENGKD